jgi:hypothetical protein
VKQYKEEWDVVMGRLESIARLVNNVGVACKRYNLEEKDLPDGLRDIFQSLETYAMHSRHRCRWLIALQGTGRNQGCSRSKQGNRRDEEGALAQGLAQEGQAV